jgi:hypothetical protein
MRRPAARCLLVGAEARREAESRVEARVFGRRRAAGGGSTVGGVPLAGLAAGAVGATGGATGVAIGVAIGVGAGALTTFGVARYAAKSAAVGQHHHRVARMRPARLETRCFSQLSPGPRAHPCSCPANADSPGNRQLAMAPCWSRPARSSPGASVCRCATLPTVALTHATTMPSDCVTYKLSSSAARPR